MKHIINGIGFVIMIIVFIIAFFLYLIHLFVFRLFFLIKDQVKKDILKIKDNKIMKNIKDNMNGNVDD